ncbi:MAG: tyrosine-type recombinase/integrase [Coxiellaceae bacterium]|nr:tyrosine-type recombinase/integrase [Coxiellaceae bacterium]
MSEKSKSPLPLFDALDNLSDDAPHHDCNSSDYHSAFGFLKAYDGSKATFNAYRREVERLLQWSYHQAKKSILELRRQEIEDYLHFCQQPPAHWIGTKKSPRFITKDTRRQANPNWRPFVVTVSKSAHRKGETPNKQDYELSESALRDIFSILSSFYNYLVQEEITDINPVASIRQKSKFLRRHANTKRIRRLTEKQWNTVLQTAEHLAAAEPEMHERTLFIMSALFAMYLRISELVSSERWSPTMNDFCQDHDGHWWFTTVGKGNKQRQITVSHQMLNALKRWRHHLDLSDLPSPADHSPLIPKVRGKGPVTSTTYVREIVQFCFDTASDKLRSDGFALEADNLIEATVHWLRHTGISEDVKHRPREHVRDDAGHSSSAITDKYIDIELKERHASGVNKPIKS